ncbi:hypothetical protein SI65_08773 [Aspergillus cristatus]|uniref:Uncharacterized protein n=1 Tax=Aspergillus cristatus TaxID=573508 RepID=A0A1E3B4P6_ASPCR|nr:hypothetical protein SI65_08773 [Aspergillus cristatus]
MPYTNDCHGIRDLSSSFINDALTDRLSNVLDSLARVLVHKPSWEVISLGARIGPADQVTVFIADNGAVGPNIMAHFWVIWERLRKLSQSFEKSQECVKRSYLINARSPALRDLSLLSDAMQNEAHDFKRCVYTHSFGKFLKRFEKGNRFDQLKKDSPFYSNPGLKEPMEQIMECLTTINELIGNSEKLPDNFNKFEVAIHIATREIQKILQDNASVSYLTSLNPTHLNFLRKVSCLTQAVNVLIQATNSPRLRRQLFFGKAVTLIPVPSLEETVRFPEKCDEY